MPEKGKYCIVKRIIVVIPTILHVSVNHVNILAFFVLLSTTLFLLFQLPLLMNSFKKIWHEKSLGNEGENSIMIFPVKIL